MFFSERIEEIEKHAYFIGLLPNEFMNMTLYELFTCFEHRMKKIDFDNDMANRRTARICAIIANANRDRKKQPRAFKEEDFIPIKQVEKKKNMSVNQMATVLKVITLANNGMVNS